MFFATNHESPDQAFDDPNFQVLFICKSRFFPDLLNHLPRLRAASFDLSIDQRQFPRFFCQLLCSFMSNGIILHPRFVKKVLVSYQNYHFLIEEDAAKLLKYLLASVFKCDDGFAMWKRNTPALQAMAVRWRYLFELAVFLKDLDSTFVRGELFALELYCSFFYMPRTSVKFQGRTKKSPSLFLESDHEKLLNSLVQNNPIISNINLFQKERTSDIELNLLEDFMMKLMLFVEDSRAKNKLENTQRTFDPLSESNFIELSDSDKEDYIKLGYICKFGIFSRNRPRLQNYTVYLKVDSPRKWK